jgi:hypothetical protein
MSDADRAAARDLSLQGVRPPARVPGYEHEQFLGHGAYGEVWVAINRNSGRKVAIKFFTRRGGLDWAALAREVEKLRYLFSDRYVVQLFEVGWESEPPYYVMEFMENGSLEDLLRAGPISVHDAVTLFREIAVALVHAHDKGILHCDLKPGNVLLDADRRPRLADFGQSRLTNEMSPALGTLFYMAPEQADLSATPDARWDVYALGAVMYRMLTGTPPHYQSTPFSEGNLEAQLAAYRRHILNAPRPTAHRKILGVDPELATIIDRCLETSPSKRFANPQEVVSALDAWQLRRVRRPLLILAAFCFSLLFLVMAINGAYVFWTSVNTAERGVIERAMNANDAAAESEAGQMAFQTQLRWLQLEAAARNTQIRDLLALGDKFAADPSLGPKLDQLLGERMERGNRQFQKADQASIWFADDATGHQRGTAPPYPNHRNQYRGYRDYFHGQGHELPESTKPAPPVIRAPYRTGPFLRLLDDGPLWTVAFSVPVGGENAGPVGIIGMTVDLKDSGPARGDPSRFPVLVDTRPDAKSSRRGLILRHPYWSSIADPKNPPLYYAESVVKWADSRSQPGQFAERENYTDPVAAGDADTPGNSNYAGTWLASLHRVRAGPEQIDTGWVVVVQERRDEVMRPVRDLQWRLSYGALGATVFVLGLLSALTIGMMSVLDGAPKSRVTRALRRWAGLPTGTASTGTTTTSATGSLGARTARMDATPAQSSEVHGQSPNGETPPPDHPTPEP